MDVVYVVRPGDVNEELRYSLRSLVNLPHDQVWIVGYRPQWVRGVQHIPLRQLGPKWTNSTANLRRACAHPGVSERFAYFNDDFFLLQPLGDDLPMWNRGPLGDVLARYAKSNSRYADGMRKTAKLLRDLGLPGPYLSYELHAPMPVQKLGMLEALAAAEARPVQGVLHKRTLYGNYWGLGGLSMPDGKLHGLRDRYPAGALWTSTTDGLFRRGLVGRQLRAAFPEPSPYELTLGSPGTARTRAHSLVRRGR